MKVLPRSLRCQLVMLVLFCTLFFLAVTGGALLWQQHAARCERASWLARQTVEWAAAFNAASPADREERRRRLEELYVQSRWRLRFTLSDAFEPVDGDPGSDQVRQFALDSFRNAHSEMGGEGPEPEFHADFPRSGGGRNLRLSVRLDDGTWLGVQRVQARHFTLERLLPWIIAAGACLVLGIMLLLFLRATRQLCILRDLALRVGSTLDTYEQLPEKGCLEIRETACALNLMRRRVLEGIAERDRMLSALRHDIRTPLTRLQLWAEEVENADVREKLFQNAAQMRDLVTQSLELAGSLETRERFVRLDVVALVGSIADDIADGGGMVTLLPMPAGIPAVTARPVCLRRCLENLIGNAVKYAGAADIAIDMADGALRVRVIDHGPGIPVEFREKVFRPWFRIEPSRSRNTGGTGLGLTIARSMARLSNASLALGETPGGGLTAIIELRI